MCRMREIFPTTRKVTNISGGARVERWVVKGVAIDAVSMLHHRLFNGNARRKSHSRLLVRPWATNRAERTVVDVNEFGIGGPSFSPTAWIHEHRLHGHTEGTMERVPVQSARVTPRRSRTRWILDEIGAREARMAKRVPTGPPNTMCQR